MSNAAVSDKSQWGHFRPNLAARLCIAALRQRIARGAVKGPVRKLLARLSSSTSYSELRRASSLRTGPFTAPRAMRRRKAAMQSAAGKLGRKWPHCDSGTAAFDIIPRAA